MLTLQDHLKERLTGATILVVVVVLLVPEMFRGRSMGAADRVGSSLEGPPVRSYTMDLRDIAPAVRAPAPVVAATAVPALALAAPATLAPALPTPVVPAPVIAAPTVRTTKARVSAPAAHSGWTVQVATFASRDYADHMLKQLRAKGVLMEVAGPDERGLYRVRSAPYANRAGALALRQKLLRKGLRPIVNTVSATSGAGRMVGTDGG